MFWPPEERRHYTAPRFFAAEPGGVPHPAKCRCLRCRKTPWRPSGKAGAAGAVIRAFFDRMTAGDHHEHDLLNGRMRCGSGAQSGECGQAGQTFSGLAAGSSLRSRKRRCFREYGAL